MPMGGGATKIIMDLLCGLPKEYGMKKETPAQLHISKSLLLSFCTNAKATLFS